MQNAKQLVKKINRIKECCVYLHLIRIAIIKTDTKRKEGMQAYRHVTGYNHADEFGSCVGEPYSF